MVYLKGIFIVRCTLMVVLATLLMHQTMASHNRIAYKKPIAGGNKSNKMRDKRMRTTKTEIAETNATVSAINKSATEKLIMPAVESRLSKEDMAPYTATTITTNANHLSEEQSIDEEPMAYNNNSNNPFSTTTEESISNGPVPCTCGIFLASQIKKRSDGSASLPIGKAIITNELDRHYTCNAIGQKQCQTKCLETIVQHLPNSANILCATLNRDCRKERAYLFIKNCRNQWINTNLAAGREYCCKNGQPYQCPMA